MTFDKMQTEELLSLKEALIHSNIISQDEEFFFLKKTLEQIIYLCTDKENIQFPSLSSRLIFIVQDFQLPRQLILEVQKIQTSKIDLIQVENKKAKRILLIFIDSLLGIPTSIEEKYTDISLQNLPLKLLRVQVLTVDKIKYQIECVILNDYSQKYFIDLNTSQNHILGDVFEYLWEGAQLNLINYQIKENKIDAPLVVLEPDYLIDASRIGECFQNFATSPYMYLLSKLEQSKSSKHILLGNLANYILDELVTSTDDKELIFSDVFLHSFQQMPFEYTVCKDIESASDFKLFMDEAKRHFDNIKRVKKIDFPSLGFDSNRCILEPSFYSEKYGFQGRLDLLQQAKEIGETTKIVELKSGKTPYPAYITTKVGINHEVQIAVYRLMIESVYNLDFTQITSMALYSSADNASENLRLVVPNFNLYKRILTFRNQIILNEYKLYTSSLADIEQLLFAVFDIDNYGVNIPAFFKDRVAGIATVYQNSSKLERVYFLRFFKFVTRELYISKVGDSDSDKSQSLAALWNTSREDRKSNLELIDNLTLDVITYDEVGMKIVFQGTSNSNIMNANFREGDICVIYPQVENMGRVAILSNQIVKGTILTINDELVEVRFRFKQKNTDYLTASHKWIVEHDKLDHSMNAMFRSLYFFLGADKYKKDLLLGQIVPSTRYSSHKAEEGDTLDLQLESQQERIISKALLADDYFLIVGPPGTGKTSVFAKNLIQRIFSQSQDNILVIAYTNRAVDELCSAILAACVDQGDRDLFIRIGSSNNCDPKFSPYLLSNIASRSKSRQELTNILKQTRIYIGTLASIVGKPELFTFKHFHVALIDEASQILEPQIVGILPQVDKFILIGDHKQLSTISLQADIHSEVKEKELINIDLIDCKESIFERLYRTVKKNNWAHAYDTLIFHGRMHQTIADLINKPFYNGILQTITDRQNQELMLKGKNEDDSDLKSIICQCRTSFFHAVNDTYVSSKINETEAKIVADLVESIIKVYESNKKIFDIEQTIGIITPYRNQIATIKSILRSRNIPQVERMMIDTVERYQGSQRDIIIVSFCFNNVYQMNNFANMDKEQKVDRKLNVALSRAREQLFLIGNRNILETKEIYAEMIKKMQKVY